MKILDPAALISSIHRIVDSPSTGWVLFSNGSFVMITSYKDKAVLVNEALCIMNRYGAAEVGASSADFSVTALHSMAGWTVSTHHQGLLSYVHPFELPSDAYSYAQIGLLGHSIIKRDSKERKIIHVHDARIHIGADS